MDDDLTVLLWQPFQDAPFVLHYFLQDLLTLLGAVKFYISQTEPSTQMATFYSKIQVLYPYVQRGVSWSDLPCSWSCSFYGKFKTRYSIQVLYPHLTWGPLILSSLFIRFFNRYHVWPCSQVFLLAKASVKVGSTEGLVWFILTYFDAVCDTFTIVRRKPAQTLCFRLIFRNSTTRLLHLFSSAATLPPDGSIPLNLIS